MSLYKKTEAMLYNFNKTKAEIRNIELDLELLKSQYEGVGAIVYEERTGSTNKFNSSVENEVVIREKRIKKLENMKKLKEVEIMKIENSLTDLTNREKNLIQMRYFNKENNRMIAAKLDLTEEYVSELKRIIVNKISNILFLNFV
ncbi:sigma factor-like helix-turn-helix DNA-binding protein [Clostridium septicum]|uniref:RNA polymerase subunit sigma n=2 Tax=Clostridium septicum TaxID=1504 RepID=A0A9N7JN95_CLOSE|nr:sigma factor-like helix-turn-helix DNA-binding protein [Clostridium septicum]AYE35299.1 RNA polymerase subunit sigma [Clostridium septicum]QAS60688.1 RNA polymerase subunit sigma [Clostridium septicum]UEC20046.1 RNA polymerase subunit sigma [Clostridium septicum]USS01898.1 RNA polymerase subunit sigma [Clostridium septicum]WLF70464.1 sigma factor-like helix-turn-helix DNA-binding protein [Clostridium septicum]